MERILSETQKEAIRPYVERLKTQPWAEGEESRNSALTLESLDQFPGAAKVHTWLIDGQITVDVVDKEGAVTSYKPE